MGTNALATADETNTEQALGGAARAGEGNTLFAILVALSVSHMLNDTIQSLIPAIYPILKSSYALSFTQIGLITLTFQLTASLLQPLVGIYTDRHPKPYSLAAGMGFTLIGLLLLSRAGTFPAILVAAGLVGVGSSIFHPESSRLARVASGGRHGMAQSLFQVGGNFGTSLGPLMAAFVVDSGGQASIAWFSIVALTAIVILFKVGRWYQNHLTLKVAKGAAGTQGDRQTLSSRRVAVSITILLILVFSKHFYLVSLGNYYTFYLMDKFDLSIRNSQLLLFVFLGAVAAGTIAGGADRRPARLQVRHLVFDPGNLAVHSALAIRQSLLDGRADGADRLHPGLGLPGDPGLRAGAGAGTRRDDRRTLLRLRVRDGRARARRSSAG